MISECSLPQSQVRATFSYPEPARSSPYSHTPLHEDDLRTLLKEMISYVFVSSKFIRINMCPILEVYGVLAAWNLEERVRIIENKWEKILNKHKVKVKCTLV